MASRKTRVFLGIVTLSGKSATIGVSPACHSGSTCSSNHERFTGHFTGTFKGLKGKGQKVDFIATDILSVRDGKITDNWHIEDNLTFQTQIGFVK